MGFGPEFTGGAGSYFAGFFVDFCGDSGGSHCKTLNDISSLEL
jgi:hypothetical protein